jgi:TrmH family RNA methyltransferase
VPTFPRISSRQHEVVKRFRNAARRVTAEAVLLDGDHLLSSALDAGVSVDVVIVDVDHRKIGERAHTTGATVYEGTAAVIEAASPVRTPSGVVALARCRPATLSEALRDRQALAIAMVGVQDPGNVGSAIRAADALDATAVVIVDGSASPWSWKALRGAMGSTFQMPVAVGALGDVVSTARERGLQIAATVATGGEAADKVDLRKSTLLLLGSEGAGLPADVIQSADVRLTIPMRAHANSLNVAATAALLAYEARRQRAQ